MLDSKRKSTRYSGVVRSDKVEAFLQHYASEYYDPVKAHDYYMKNRQLKGRTSSGMSDEQKKAWTYTKAQVTTEKKSKITEQRAVKEQQIDEFRAKAEVTRKRISEKLKLLREKITSNAEADREKIVAKRQADIDNIPPIPKNISPDQRAILMAQRKQAIADIRSDIKADKDGISDEAKKERTTSSDSASIERDETRAILKTAITEVRDAYEKAKEDLNAKYEQTFDDEYSNVLSNIRGKSKIRKTRKRR